MPTSAIAQTASTPSQHQTAEKLFLQTCKNLQGRSQFTVDVDITYDNVLDSGAKVQYSAEQQIWVAKPNRLRSDYVGDERHTRFYYDGRTFTYESPDQNLYATKTAPDSIDGMVAAIVRQYGIAIPLSNLFTSDPCAAIESNNVQNILYVGESAIDGIPSRHLLVVGEDRDFQLWISKTNPPLLQKIIITYKDLPASPQYTAILSNWNFSDRIPDEIFTFTPSKDATAIEFLPPEFPDSPDN